MVAQKSDKFFLFTVDVEDWFQVENFKASIPFDTWDDRELRVEQNTHKLLDLLGDEKGEGSRIPGFRGSSETNKTTNQLNQQTNNGNQNSEFRSQNSVDRGQECAAESMEVPNSLSRISCSSRGWAQPTTHNPQHSTHTNVRATFFVLGWVAKKLPGLIREIHQRGHEVASHGNNHHLCTTESAGLLQKDLAGSKALLEDIIGSRVVGYRAPSFSINDDVLKVIEDAGYQYDASFNSFDKHGRYGRISTNGFRKTGIAYQISESFYEIPISNLCLQPSTFSLLRSSFNRKPFVLPLGGGGYFRLFPYMLFKKGIRRILQEDNAYSFYLHPWEVDPGQPRVKNAPASLKFRHYINLASNENKVRRMLADFRDCRFVTCREYLDSLS